MRARAELEADMEERKQQLRAMGEEVRQGLEERWGQVRWGGCKDWYSEV